MTSTIPVSRVANRAVAIFAAALFLVLSAAFGAGTLVGPLWDRANWLDSAAITWLLTGLILAAGFAQARRPPTAGFARDREPVPDAAGRLDPGAAALLALPLRFFAGRLWLGAALAKQANPGWMDTGQALHGFWQGAVAVGDGGQGKITYGWFRILLQYMDDHRWYVWFSRLIVGGEGLVGLALLLGGLVGLAAMGGVFMNLNYGLAGAASANPILLAIGLLLAMSGRAAGYWGLDRWLLPALPTPGRRSPVGAAAPDEDDAALEATAVAPLRR